MRKIGILMLVLVVALASMGVGYAMWDKTLYIDGTVNTGVFKVGFTSIVRSWDSEDWANWNGLPWKEVGDAKCELFDSQYVPETDKTVYKTLHMTITNGYPCYWAINKFTLDNAGTIPAHFRALIMRPGPGLVISGYEYDVNGRVIGWVLDDLDDNPVLNVWLYKEPPDYGDGWYKDPPTMFPPPWPHSLICNQIDPCDELLTELYVHVKQASLENHIYTFDIDIVASQWNE